MEYVGIEDFDLNSMMMKRQDKVNSVMMKPYVSITDLTK